MQIKVTKSLIVGSSTLDTIASFVSETHLSNHITLEQGRKHDATSIVHYPGGGAMNVAINLNLHKHAVHLVSKIGNDAGGKVIMDKLKQQGVSSQFITTTHLPTGSSVHLVNEEGNPALLISRASNTLLNHYDIPAVKDYDLAFICPLSNESADYFSDMVMIIHGLSKRTKIISNPGIRQLSKPNNGFYESLNAIHYLVLNKLELQTLTQALGMSVNPQHTYINTLPPLSKPLLDAQGNAFQLTDATQQLIVRYGIELIILTDGGNGAYVVTKDKALHCKAKRVETMVSSTGAGDAFSSTFFATYHATGKLEESLQKATLQSASVIQKIDAQTGLLPPTQLHEEWKQQRQELTLSQWTFNQPPK